MRTYRMGVARGIGGVPEIYIIVSGNDLFILFTLLNIIHDMPATLSFASTVPSSIYIYVQDQILLSMSGS